MVEWQRGHTIGRSASATVSLATNLQSGEVFAVKSVEFSHSHCLQREQSILSSLSSPFVISCLGSDFSRDASTNKLYYNMFMELAHGGSLSDEIRRCGGRLDEPSIRYHTYRILSGLAYLHKNGIIHSDIKPLNVLVDSAGNSKIADFGCARRDSTVNDHAQICGTPMYMAPEVSRGEEQGTAADVWALGCTVIEMTTGGAPWPGFSDPVSVLHHIGHSSEMPVLPESISDEARDFLSKCLVRDSKQRWSAEKLLNHPFVASSDNSLPEKSTIQSWVSPKSVLDQELWQSEAIDWKEELLERIKILACGETNGPDWSRDESWISVRGNDIDREEEVVSVSTSSNNFDFVFVNDSENYVHNVRINCEMNSENLLLDDSSDDVNKNNGYCLRLYYGCIYFFSRYLCSYHFQKQPSQTHSCFWLQRINCTRIQKSSTNFDFKL